MGMEINIRPTVGLMMWAAKFHQGKNFWLVPKQVWQQATFNQTKIRQLWVLIQSSTQCVNYKVSHTLFQSSLYFSTPCISLRTSWSVHSLGSNIIVRFLSSTMSTVLVIPRSSGMLTGAGSFAASVSADINNRMILLRENNIQYMISASWTYNFNPTATTLNIVSFQSYIILLTASLFLGNSVPRKGTTLKLAIEILSNSIFYIHVELIWPKKLKISKLPWQIVSQIHPCLHTAIYM